MSNILGQRYEEAVAFVSALLRRQPDLLRKGKVADAIGELAVLRLFLLQGGKFDLPAHAGGSPAAHERLGRRLAAGLDRLPSFAGPVALRAPLTDAELSRYEERHSIVAGRCCATTFSGTPGQAGNTDFVTFSVEGRHTAVLEASDPDVVLFPPSTFFTVLCVRRGAPGQRNVVFLRELRSQADQTHQETDRGVLRQLEMALADWQRDEKAGIRRTSRPHRLFHPPLV
ncbi:hypothetical protein [Streptomyces sp. NPDC090080]|uniref:hypothetical protein n=1 Tax=Streptomyces sp. NPDC090080 TaxID=3365939 RepID=UPI0038068226